MKVVDPKTISEQIKNASEVEVTLAGPKGIDKLKLATVRFLRRAAEGTAEILKDEEVAGLVAFGVIGLAASVVERNMPTAVKATSVALTSLPFVGMAAGAGVKPLKDLEYKLVKKIQADRPSLLQRRQMKGTQYA